MPHHGLLPGVTMAVFAVEGGTQTRALIGDRPRNLSPRVAAFMGAPPTDAAAWAHAAHDRARIARNYAAAFTHVDVIVTPTTPEPAPRIEDDEAPHLFRVVPYTAAVNMVGLPAVSIPMGADGGLPLGVQVIGPIGGDALVLRVAAALEQASPVHRVARPPL